MHNMRVKIGVLTDAAEEMQRAAAAIPAAPKSVSPSGADPLTAAITALVAAGVEPLVVARPSAKQQTSGFAKNMGAAARAYAGTDEHEGENINQSMPGRPASG